MEPSSGSVSRSSAVIGGAPGTISAHGVIGLDGTACAWLVITRFPHGSRIPHLSDSALSNRVNYHEDREGEGDMQPRARAARREGPERSMDMPQNRGARKMSQLQESETNMRLGYPSDARLLIINADDFGMCYAINDAILRSLKDGVVCSTSVMVPCPWALHAMHLLAENPDIPFGIHLTVICDTVHYRWGPLTCKDKVPSLLDETGYFYSPERIPEFAAQAKLEELEVEFRAQIDTVLAANLTPTHLDWHCLRNGGRADIFDLTLRLAKEHGFAVRVAEQPL